MHTLFTKFCKVFDVIFVFEGIPSTIASYDVRTLPPRDYGGALVVWPGMPFPNRW